MATKTCAACSADISSMRAGSKYCSKLISERKKGKWTVHHVDEDRQNNKLSNLKLLCKRCHQIRHKCWDNFSKV